MMEKQFSAACERNREPILKILRDVFADRKHVLEIGSGTGQHAVYFGAELSHVIWQTSDLPNNHPSIVAWQKEANLKNILSPIVLNVASTDWPKQRFDAVFSANTCHIMSWDEVVKMFAGINQSLISDGIVCIYGPFNYNGTYTSLSNAQFDASLKQHSVHMGIRDFEAINDLAESHEFHLQTDYSMPANNRLLVWQRHG